MVVVRESDLYPPIKAHLEGAGYIVRGEVGRCDMVGVQDGAVVAVELKLSFGLPVLYQALDRLPFVDLVYVAVAVPEGRRARTNWDAQLRGAIRLCRMLGVGLLSVRDGVVVVHADPGPYRLRKQPKTRVKLLSEFTRRTGDHNVGGTSRRPRVTAYREDSLRCVGALAAGGILSPAQVRKAANVEKAAGILLRNVYGWFEKIERGRYALSPAGREALVRYADVIAAQAVPIAQS